MSERGEIIREAPPAREAPDVIQLPPPRPRRRGGVRRPAADPCSARIELRTTPARKAAIRDEAKRAGLSITDYLLRSRRRRSAPAAPVADPLILTRLLGELGKIGSNHNQLAHAFNATGETPGRAAWERQDRAIQEMRAALLQALGR